MGVAACFQLRNDVFQVRTAFNGVYEYVVHAQLMESVLDDAVVSVAGMGSAVSHDEGSIMGAHLRELGGQSFQEINDLVRFTFGALEVHEWGSQGNFLEVRSLHLGDYGVIAVFHARNHVQGYNCYTGIAFSFQFSKASSGVIFVMPSLAFTRSMMMWEVYASYTGTFGFAS